MPISDKFKLLGHAELQEKLKGLQPQFTPIAEYKAPEVLIPLNPVHESNKLLREQNDKIDELSEKLNEANKEISNQTKELQSIHYENMKLNSQIDILNKTIDSQNDELTKLRDVNTELKLANKMLEESNRSNRGYWLKTILIAIMSWILGVISNNFF